MFGRNNPLKELDGDEYKLAREDGFARGRRTGWLVSALLGIPGVAVGFLAGVGTGGAAFGLGAIAGGVLFPLLAIAGALVIGAMAQMYSDRRNSKRAADMLLNQRELMLQKEGRGEPSQNMAPEGQEQGQKPEKGNAGRGQAPAKSGQTPPASMPYPPAPHMMPHGMGGMMPSAGYAPPPVMGSGPVPPPMGAPIPSAPFHNVATSPQVPTGRVMGNYTAQYAAQQGMPAPAMPVPART